MIKFIFFALLTGYSSQLWAGTEITARLESAFYKQSWVDLDLLVGDGHVRINFTGPLANGALIYDKMTSDLILLDGFGKTAIPITRTDQMALKFMGSMGDSRLQDEMKRSLPSVKLAYNLVVSNLCALLNGSPALTEKGCHVNGFACDLYQTKAGDNASRKVWLVTPRATTLSPDDYETLRSLRSLAFDLGGPLLKDFGVNLDAYPLGDSTPQLPALIALYVDGKESCRLVVHKIRPKTLEPSAFEPPADYQRMSVLEMVKEGM